MCILRIRRLYQQQNAVSPEALVLYVTSPVELRGGLRIQHIKKQNKIIKNQEFTPKRIKLLSCEHVG